MVRDATKEGVAFTDHKLIKGQGLERRYAAGLANVSYRIEAAFGYPVRIEYQTRHSHESGTTLFLLQARATEKLQELDTVATSELVEGPLLAGSYDVNISCDITLPAVVIYEERWYRHIAPGQARALDERFADGYVLICDYLQFYDDDYHSVTPHKRAVVAGSNAGRNHNLEIAQKLGIPYMSTDGLGIDLMRNNVGLKTGHRVRFVSDGIRGLLYLAE